MPKATDNYSIQVFSSPEKLEQAICKLAKKEKSKLSRLITTYDWEYNAKSEPEKRSNKYWEVFINDWHKPWNRELESELSPKQKRRNKQLAWAEQEQTIKK